MKFLCIAFAAAMVLLPRLARAAETTTSTPAIKATADVSALARLESDLFTFGIFPNSAGFMDARIYARARYWEHLSSGLYFDYTTARALSEDPGKRRNDRLVREYRFEADVLKGIFVFFNAKRDGTSRASGSLEPGFNAKFLAQDIQESGYTRNTFDETVFRSTDTTLYSMITSVKLDSTLAFGRLLTLDLSGEWLPLVYTFETGRTQSSQFPSPVSSSITNRTYGWQGTATVALNLERYGRYSLRAKGYRNVGQVSARAALISGNFEYTFETYGQSAREDYSLELIHTASYLKFFGVLCPAFGVAVQRKRFETTTDSFQADVIKLALLLEIP